MVTVKKLCVLLTGSTGVLGQALLDALDAEEVVALIHRKGLGRSDVEEHKGDITMPRLGLPEEQYDALARRVNCIVHCAAVTKLDAAYSDMLTTNAIGTEHLVGFAMNADAAFVYVSTAYVQEGFSQVGSASAYEDSKRQAEKAVKKLGHNVTVIRPSIIVGDSQNGTISKHQGFHNVVGSMVDCTLPVLPSTPGMLCDFVPQDLVAEAIVAAVRNPGEVDDVWVTSGTHALTVDEIIAVARTVGERYGFCGAPPRIVPYEVVERLFMPVFIKNLPPSMRRRFEGNVKLARYMNQLAPMPSSVSFLGMKCGRRVETPMPRLVLERNMECWVRKRLNKPAIPHVSPIEAAL